MGSDLRDNPVKFVVKGIDGLGKLANEDLVATGAADEDWQARPVDRKIDPIAFGDPKLPLALCFVLRWRLPEAARRQFGKSLDLEEAQQCLALTADLVDQ